MTASELFSAVSSSHLATLVIEQWVRASAIFLERLHADAARIASWLNYSEIPDIAKLSPAGSEMHDENGTSIRVEFADGRCVFYKPRAVTGEILWHQLAQLTGAANPACKIAAARVLEGQSGGSAYGWMEELQPITIASDGECTDYWERSGSLLCHAWIARLTDLHMANVIATSSGPSVADAECLATPYARVPGRQATELALTEQLAGTGLLPSRGNIYIDGRNAQIPDVSGLFGQSAYAGDLRIPALSFQGDGAFILTLEPALLTEQCNRGKQDGPLACLPAMVDGFMCAADAFLQIREQLLAPNGWVECLETNHASRVNLCSTLSYGLRMTDKLLTRKGGSSGVRSHISVDARDWPSDPCVDCSDIVDEENRSLEDLYVPRFVTPPGSRDIHAVNGKRVAHNAFALSGAESVRMQLEGLSLLDLRSRAKVAILASVMS